MKMLYIALALGLTGPATQAETVHSAWVQFNGQGQPIARAIVEAAQTGTTACPSLDHSTGSTHMSLRTQGVPDGFEAVRVCEGEIAANMDGMSVAGIPLPTPTPDPVHIAVLGDTGCRVKGADIQNCTGKGPGLPWDYVGMANAVAAEAPDLIVHVGDMHYREFTAFCGDSCIPGNIGYTWQSWKVDYFDPSAKMFQAAPVLPVRGNHEDCTRAWRGWFFFLDPNPITLQTWPDQCPRGQSPTNDGSDWFFTLPYQVVFEKFQLVVMDTSYIADDYGPTPDAEAVRQYGPEFEVANAFASAAAPLPSILVSHRPFWAVSSYHSHGQDKAAMSDLTLQRAIGTTRTGALAENFDMTIAGHIHMAQKLSFRDGRPVQFVFGNSGTKRDPALGSNGRLTGYTQAALAKLKVQESDFYWSWTFDYGVIRPGADKWSVIYKDKTGGQLASFDVAYDN